MAVVVGVMVEVGVEVGVGVEVVVVAGVMVKVGVRVSVEVGVGVGVVVVVGVEVSISIYGGRIMDNLKSWVTDLVAVIGFIGVVIFLTWVGIEASGPGRSVRVTPAIVMDQRVLDELQAIKQRATNIEMRLTAVQGLGAGTAERRPTRRYVPKRGSEAE